MVPKPFDLTALRKVLALVHMLPPYDFNLPGECFVAVLEEPLEGVGAVTTPADAAKRWAHLAAANHGLPQYIEFCTLFRRLRTDGNRLWCTRAMSRSKRCNSRRRGPPLTR